MDQDFINGLIALVGEEQVRQQEPMERHTTFRIGGPADCFVTPRKVEEIQKITVYCRERQVPYYIVGNGSNLLVSDEGYRGVIIQIYKKMSAVRTEGKRICAQAGALLSRVAAAALDAGLTGLEFASGIPGTLGGACVMNAGAYGGEMKDVLERVTVLSPDGELRVVEGDEMELGYRTSMFARKDCIVLEAEMVMEQGDRAAIRQRMEELKRRRIVKQPLEYPSAGSTFKRPEGYFAGKLIQDAGLRGYRVGGAQISEKHCGFVINSGNATARDVNTLMKRVTEIVWEKFGVRLEAEVKKLGDF